ncbi:hypothetical protein CR513_55453, partial [Mucuna pruriens]
MSVKFCEVLLTKNQASADLVKKYAERNDHFFERFAKSMDQGERSERTAEKLTPDERCQKD